MARVIDLQPGDEVSLVFNSAVFIARTAHPLYVGLELVVWRMADGSWSHDALNRQQEVGEVTPSDQQTRIGRLRSALHGGGVMSAPLGFMVVRDEDGKVVADWDAEAHASYEDAETELIKCQAAVTSYRWFLVELRKAGCPADAPA